MTRGRMHNNYPTAILGPWHCGWCTHTRRGVFWQKKKIYIYTCSETVVTHSHDTFLSLFALLTCESHGARLYRLLSCVRCFLLTFTQVAVTLCCLTVSITTANRTLDLPCDLWMVLALDFQWSARQRWTELPKSNWSTENNDALSIDWAKAFHLGKTDCFSKSNNLALPNAIFQSQTVCMTS